MTPEARASVEKLFAEPFEPEWATHGDRVNTSYWFMRMKAVACLWKLEQSAVLDIISRGEMEYRIVEAYREVAAESRRRISRRCDQRGNYSNGFFMEYPKNWSRHSKRQRIAI